MNTLTGKVAIVTGASKGIGAGIAKRLAVDGAAVIVNYVRGEQAAAAVVNQIVGAGGRAVAVQADVGRPEQIQKLMDAALSHFGRLDILVNNAGLYRLDTLDTITPDSFAEHFDLNVRGLVLASQAAARVLPAGGVIINITSGVATSPSPGAHIYCASKAAVNALTRTMGAELGARQIRVVGIAPGLVATEGNAGYPQEMTDHFVSKTPLARVGMPADIGAAVSLAVSADAAWITGTTIDVAGGMVF